jgi:hypothetical protein
MIGVKSDVGGTILMCCCPSIENKHEMVSVSESLFRSLLYLTATAVQNRIEKTDVQVLRNLDRGR